MAGFSKLFSASAVSVLLAALNVVSATSVPRATTCPCGYKDETGAIWREGFYSDFTSNWQTALNANFYVVSSSALNHGTGYLMESVSSNVFSYNYGLGLRTSKYNGAGTVYTSEIDTLRADIQFGTFRTRATVPTVPGVCFGFFSYHQNSDGTNVQETDIEFLSSDAAYYDTIHYTNQPGTVNGVVNTNAAKVATVGTDLTAFNNHRWDWHPTASTFYVNGAQTSQITVNVPQVGSTIIANVWSDGGSWTHGPPTADAIATIYHIAAYFNSTTLSAATFNSQCASAGHPAPCGVVA